jgi:protein tyrosine phosphatase (PTP) superfamily phosphohydrolase (DUF442 family)
MSDAIFNFRRIDAQLASAGQPTAPQLRELAAGGCRAVVNLHMDDPRWALPGEQQLVQELGMSYHHIPVVFDAPATADYRRFASTLDALHGVSTLVHCVANYRASCFLALYGEQQLGWDRQQADSFVADVWEPDPVWRQFLERMRDSFNRGER